MKGDSQWGMPGVRAPSTSLCGGSVQVGSGPGQLGKPSSQLGSRMEVGRDFRRSDDSHFPCVGDMSVSRPLYIPLYLQVKKPEGTEKEGISQVTEPSTGCTGSV